MLPLLSPWTTRTYLLDGRVVLMTTGARVTLHGANDDVVPGDVRRWGTWILTSVPPEGAWGSQMRMNGSGYAGPGSSARGSRF